MVLILLSIVLFVLVYSLLKWKESGSPNLLAIVKRGKLATKLTNSINNLYDKKVIVPKKWRIKTSMIILLSITSYVISTVVLYLLIKVLSTAMILSLPILFSPIIISKMVLQNNKRKISNQILFYSINIKNQVKGTNDILQAIKRAKVELPLSKYVDEFTTSIFRGANIQEAFRKMRCDVDVKDFTDLIIAFETSHKNGGDFSKILEKYILMKTKERIQKDEMTQKSQSAVITLVVMMLLNIFVIITFLFGNQEYMSIIRSTIAGKVILNLNALAFLANVLIINNIYKEE